MTAFDELLEDAFEPEDPEGFETSEPREVTEAADVPDEATEEFTVPEPLPIETASGLAVLEAARRLETDPDARARMFAMAGCAMGSFAIRPVGLAPKDPRDALLYRSRKLSGAAEYELAALVRDFQIKSIYDVRSARERAAETQLFPLGTKTIALRPTASDRPKEASKWLRAGHIARYGAPEARMQDNYRRYVDDYPIIGAALRGIATEAVPTLVHCENGKDRTGVLCAVVLYAAGASWDIIVADYLAANIVNATSIAAEAAHLGAGMTDEERDILMSFLEARAVYLAAFFDEAERRYGSLERYLTEGLRLTSAQRVNLSAMAQMDAFAAPTDLMWRQSQRSHTRLEDAAFWDAKARDYDEAAEADTFVKDILRALDVKAGEQVLDMGCGTGQIALALAKRGCDVVAADFSREMLAVLREKLAKPSSADVKDHVAPLMLAWDDDWQSAGLTENCVDVALSVRSFSTENMAAALEKLTRVARRSATVVMSMGHSPRVMPELLEGVRIQVPANRDADVMVEHLRQAGYRPHVRVLAEQRKREFADFDEARTWGLKMIALTGANVAAPEAAPMRERLDRWLEWQFRRRADRYAYGGDTSFHLTQTLRWAVITWDCTK